MKLEMTFKSLPGLEVISLDKSMSPVHGIINLIYNKLILLIE